MRLALFLSFAVVCLCQDDASSTSSSTSPTPTATVATTTTTAANTTCTAMQTCYKDEDCLEGGRCLGAFIGKCNCNACINFWRCEDDSACGGLQGACDLKSNTCKCIEAYTALGYTTFLDALQKLCNVKTCDRDTNDCHGLPCYSGVCLCKNP